MSFCKDMCPLKVRVSLKSDVIKSKGVFHLVTVSVNKAVFHLVRVSFGKGVL